MNESINKVGDEPKDMVSGPMVDHFNEMDNGLKVVEKRKDDVELLVEGDVGEVNFNMGILNDKNKVTKKNIGRRSITEAMEVARKVKEIREMIRVSWRLTEEERKKVDDNVGNKIQDTKCEVVDDKWIKETWGGKGYGYSHLLENGNSGGIMVIWDTRVFDCKEVIGDERFIAVRGSWKGKDKDVILVCIYGPHINKDSIGGRKFTRVSDDELKFNRKLSDHCPIVLKDMELDFGPKPFWVFNTWLDESDFLTIVEGAWRKDVKSIRPDCIFRDKLKNVKTILRGWSKDRFGGHTKKIENLKKEAMRVWCEEPVVIKTEMARHYKRLFSETRKSRPIFCNSKVGRISFEDAHRLEIAFSENKVWEAIRGCGGDKVSRPDDLNFKFIIKVWNIIKPKLLGAITWFWGKKDLERV
ncbi:putative RNA-directed DNA polymerase, eukaryota [Tanacetum coccineum]